MILQSNRELKYPILLNIATCLYKKKQYGPAVEICNKILEEKHGQYFTKAYYKKACILNADGKYEEAKYYIFYL
jgi:tetratricopeptide (TPR) repeat protein